MCHDLWEILPRGGRRSGFQGEQEEQHKNSHLGKFAQMAVKRNTFVIYKLRQYPHDRS